MICASSSVAAGSRPLSIPRAIMALSCASDIRSITVVVVSSSLGIIMSAFDVVDGASSATSKCYRLVASKPERFKEVRPGNETAFGVLKELARTRRRDADKVVARIGRTRVGQRTLKCVVLIGTRSAQSI